MIVSQPATQAEMAALRLRPADLGSFTGIGHSVEDCLYKASWGMKEHLELLREQGLPVPAKAERPTVLLIQDEERAA